MLSSVDNSNQLMLFLPKELLFSEVYAHLGYTDYVWMYSPHIRDPNFGAFLNYGNYSSNTLKEININQRVINQEQN